MGTRALDLDESPPGLGPSPSPSPDRVTIELDLPRDVLVVDLVEGHQDDGGPLHEADGGGARMGDVPEDLLLTFGDADSGSRSWHDLVTCKG